MKKLAVIKTDESGDCPFGLPIAGACKTVGVAIMDMTPFYILPPETSKTEVMDVVENNNNLFLWKATGERCPYATKFFKDKEAVECNWGTATEGEEEGALPGSQFYPKQFTGVGVEGLYSYPGGYFMGYSLQDPLYNGSYSVESFAEETQNDIVKETKSTNKK